MVKETFKKNMSYYQKKLFLAQVDKDDNIIGKVERWRAHEAGILHRGFTAILTYKNQFVLQHRKHPAFDKCWDLTFSSHQIYLEDDRPQDNLEAIYESLKREWNLEKKDLKTELKYLGKFYYKARDPNSIYTEHEIDYIYATDLKSLPSPNPNYAYGLKLINKQEFLIPSHYSLTTNFCPWVKGIIDKIAL